MNSSAVKEYWCFHSLDIPKSFRTGFKNQPATSCPYFTTLKYWPVLELPQELVSSPFKLQRNNNLVTGTKRSEAMMAATVCDSK